MTLLKIEAKVPKETFHAFGKALYGALDHAKEDRLRIHVAGFSDGETFHILLPPELLTDAFSDLLGTVAMQHGAVLNEKIEEV